MFNVQQDSRRCRHSLRAPETRTEPSSQVSQREPAAAQYYDLSTRSEVRPFQRIAHDIIGDQKKWKTSFWHETTPAQDSGRATTSVFH